MTVDDDDDNEGSVVSVRTPDGQSKRKNNGEGSHLASPPRTDRSKKLKSRVARGKRSIHISDTESALSGEEEEETSSKPVKRVRPGARTPVEIVDDDESSSTEENTPKPAKKDRSSSESHVETGTLDHMFTSDEDEEEETSAMKDRPPSSAAPIEILDNMFTSDEEEEAVVEKPSTQSVRQVEPATPIIPAEPATPVRPPEQPAQPSPQASREPWNAFPTAARPGIDDNTVGLWKNSPRAGYVFLRAGDAYMTRHCRQLAHRAGYNVYVHREWGLQPPE